MFIDVSIVTVGVNHKEMLRALLDSIRSCQAGVSLEVIVVDNASRDGTREMVYRNYPEVHLIYNPQISGYARNCNLGIQQSQGRYVLILNPDVVILQDALPRLLSFMESNPMVGIVGPQLIYPDGSLQLSCRGFSTPWVTFLRGLALDGKFDNSRSIRGYLMADWSHDRPLPVGWVMGAAMMARRTAIDHVGLMDDSFFLYFEDQDWCYRMWKNGWEVYYYPYARMIHHHPRASAKLPFSKLWQIHVRSMVRFFAKHGLEPWKLNYELRKRQSVWKRTRSV